MSSKSLLIKEITEQIEVLSTIAIPREKDAYKFYVDMANKASSQSTKRLFAELAKQEINHQNTLTTLKEQLLLERERLKKE